jgi:hypothetical protein
MGILNNSVKLNYREMANKLDLADAQIMGWAYGRSGLFLTSLIEGMGLTKSEWIKLKAKYPKSLTDPEIKEVDEYFNRKKRRT